MCFLGAPYIYISHIPYLGSTYSTKMFVFGIFHITWGSSQNVDFILKRALSPIVRKKWDPGILEPSPFSAKIREIEERLGKFIQNIRKVGGET